MPEVELSIILGSKINIIGAINAIVLGKNFFAKK